MTQHTLELPEVDLVYDVYGPLPTADGRPPLVHDRPADGRERVPGPGESCSRTAPS